MKKTTKENPITTFRKNFETRTKTVMSSLKKAQDGIITNTTQGPTLDGYQSSTKQGPLSKRASNFVDWTEHNRTKYPLSTDESIKDIKNYDLDPKNSKRIEKGKQENYKVSKNYKKNYKQDFKNLPKDSDEKKERRVASIATAIVEGIVAPPLIKTVAKHWNLDKKTGGAVKKPIMKKGGPVKYKTGGATKATKFAALAPPFNKATAADRIAGAKKNARKKK